MAVVYFLYVALTVVLFALFMLSPDQTGRRSYNIFNLSVRSSVRPFFRLLPNVGIRHFETNEPMLMPIGTSGSRGKIVKQSSLWRSGWQRSRSNAAEDRFGGMAEALVSIPLCRAPFSTILGRAILDPLGSTRFSYCYCSFIVVWSDNGSA